MELTEYSECLKGELEEMKLLLELYEKIKDNETFRAFFEEEDRIKLERLQI